MKNTVPRGKIRKTNKHPKARDSVVTRRQAASRLKIVGLKQEIS